MCYPPAFAAPGTPAFAIPEAGHDTPTEAGITPSGPGAASFLEQAD